MNIKSSKTLVEEALKSRGFLKGSNIYNPIFENVLKEITPINNNKISNKSNSSYFEEDFIKTELSMINEFLEYKLFKKIMYQNKKK